MGDPRRFEENKKIINSYRRNIGKSKRIEKKGEKIKTTRALNYKGQGKNRGILKI